MYLPRIFVARSTVARSRPWRSRASRRLLPISNTGPDCTRGSFERPQDLVEGERERAHQADVEAEPGEPFAPPQRALVRGDRAANSAPGHAAHEDRGEREEKPCRDCHDERIQELDLVQILRRGDAAGDRADRKRAE